MNYKTSILLAVLAIIAAIFVSGCTSKNESQYSQEYSQTTESSQRSFTMDEVSKHNTEKDCWVVIHDKVYDVTSFIPSHPGGKAILQGCGKDATELFESKHSDKAKKMLNGMLIGNLVQ